MTVIAIVSAKGGVGKTTLAANLSVALRGDRHNVLSLDLDPQNALRLHFGISPNYNNGLAVASISKKSWLRTIVQGESGGAILPYGLVNEDQRQAFEKILQDNPGYLLRELNKLNLSDDARVLLDVPPGPSVYMKEALLAANVVVVVMLADAASYATLTMMMGLIEKYCSARPSFIDYMYIINQIDRSRELASDIVDVMRAQVSNKAIAVVHQDQAIPEALACCQDVLSYEPQSRGAHDMTETAMLIEQILDNAKG